MRRGAIRIAIALYPRRWRQRYGQELNELAAREAEGSYRRAAGVLWDLAARGVAERVHANQGRPAFGRGLILAILAALAVQISVPECTTTSILGVGYAAPRPHLARMPAAQRHAPRLNA